MLKGRKFGDRPRAAAGGSGPLDLPEEGGAESLPLCFGFLVCKIRIKNIDIIVVWGKLNEIVKCKALCTIPSIWSTATLFA